MTLETTNAVVDADGHVMEDLNGIVARLPAPYREDETAVVNPFPPTDHLHWSNKHFLPEGAFADAGIDGWNQFVAELGIERSVLYPTRGLMFGRVVSVDWAIELARAYNDWIFETYLKPGSCYQAMGLIPLQEPAEAVIELRRIVKDYGMVGAFLPSTGAAGLQSHLGSSRYWPIYAEAEALGVALGIHGGAHDNMLMDDMSPYAPVNALGHPYGQMVNFAGLLFNGVFDRYPGVRIAFLEAGCAWLITCMERFTSAWESHVQYDPRGRFLSLLGGESIADYINRQIDENRIFVGIEGDELSLAFAIATTGNKPYVFSSDFPHEVNIETCRKSISAINNHVALNSGDKAAILSNNARQLYRCQ